MKKPFSTYYLIVTAVMGICLIAKVYFIRRILKVEVNVTELIIPGTLTLFYEIARHKFKEKTLEERKKWLHPLPWSIGIIIITAISVWVYQL